MMQSETHDLAAPSQGGAKEKGQCEKLRQERHVYSHQTPKFTQAP